MTRKTSAPTHRAALASQLKDMFRTLSARPVPDTIMSVVEQLDEGQGGAQAKRRAGS